MLKEFLIVASGSFFGGGCRYLFSQLSAHWFSNTLPWGTLLVNVLGCFFVGILCGYAEKNTAMNSSLLLLLVTGFCGGFTTFSTFINESYGLMKSQFLLMIAYMTLNLVLGMLLFYVGRLIIR
ncbi:MAG: fluoride efflux transporter CrcB [Bacteroidales bacterium]|nr:fluoride efflux transporter CrcB [Bacteroidales bacterium]